MFPDEKSVQSELTNIFGLTYIMSLPISPAAGAVVDLFAKRYRETEKNELKGKAFGVAFICGFCSVFGAVISYLAAFQHNYSIAGNNYSSCYNSDFNPNACKKMNNGFVEKSTKRETSYKFPPYFKVGHFP